MNITEITMTALQVMVLVTAISMDAFAAGFAYGISKVKMPAASVGIVSAVSALMLFVSILAGRVLSGYLTDSFTAEAGFIILFVLGIVKLFAPSGRKEAEEADRDGNHILSAGEAVTLGIALSLDSIAAGIGVGVGVSGMLWAVPAALCINYIVMKLGGRLGRLLSDKIHAQLSWISGVLLIVLAFMRLL